MQHAVCTTIAATVVPRIVRNRLRSSLGATPPPLPLISLSPEDDWEEFDQPTRTGFSYALPHVELLDEDAAQHEREPLGSESEQDRAKLCRLLRDYMSQNEMFQTPRHAFGIDQRMVYKRNKLAAEFPSNSDDDELQFNSFFESGNLDRVFRVSGRQYATIQELTGQVTTRDQASASSHAPPFAFFVKADMEYDLYCDKDLRTHGHIQWYFFQVRIPQSVMRQHGQKHSLKIRFNIRNMLKKSSLYNTGMLPVVYIDGGYSDNRRRGWHHAGTNVCYFKNASTYRHPKTGRVTNFYTLSFVYELEIPTSALQPNYSGNGDDQDDQEGMATSVYFAHCYPYTYSRLQQFLLTLQKDPERTRNFKRRVLCKTIAGNTCDVLTITDFAIDDEKSDGNKRTGVVLTARVHPGESNASFIMHGIIDFLTGNTLEARFLRHHFVFKIVPMLNPDGVVHGNYRCSLAGTDLNRRWTNPSPDLHPTIYATKNMLLLMKRTRPISLYCDIHGHSRKKNIFLYGCRPFNVTSRSEAARVRLFPHVLSKTCGSTSGGFYSFPDCTFSVNGSKKGTGRVVVWREVEVLHSFTLEASFYGVGVNKSDSDSKSGNRQPTFAKPFKPGDLRVAGLQFCRALIPFFQMINLTREPVGVPASATHAEPSPQSSPQSRPQSAVAATKKVQSGNSLQRSFSSAAPLSLESESLSPVPVVADNKIRLAPLSSPTVSKIDENAQTYREEAIAFADCMATPQECLLPPKVSQFLPLVSPLTVATPRAVAKPQSGMPSEFDEMFASPEFSSMFSLSDPEDLLKEIEAALPDNLEDDSSDEEESAGSESDPSGDNMEEEELARAEEAAEPDELPFDIQIKEPSPVLKRLRPARVRRNLSEPRM